jgi:hypothetical protein
MKANVGTIDKIIRILVGLVIIGLYFLNVINGTLTIVLLILAGVLILTGLFRVCPLYMPFGIKTCK